MKTAIATGEKRAFMDGFDSIILVWQLKSRELWLTLYRYP